MRGEWLSQQELIVYYCHVLLYCSCLQGSGNESVFVHRFKIYERVSWQIQNKSTVVSSMFFWLLKTIYHQLLSAACRISGNPIPLYCSLSNVNWFHFFSGDMANQRNGHMYFIALGQPLPESFLGKDCPSHHLLGLTVCLSLLCFKKLCVTLPFYIETHGHASIFLIL